MAAIFQAMWSYSFLWMKIVVFRFEFLLKLLPVGLIDSKSVLLFWWLDAEQARSHYRAQCSLTHWGRVTHICVNTLTIIGSDNDLSPRRRQAIVKTNDRILLIRAPRTSFSEILIHIHTISRKCIWKCRLDNGGHISRPQCVKKPVASLDHYRINAWNASQE